MPYRSIQDPAQLRRLLEATLLLESDLELPTLLRHIVEEARSMTAARYGALGVVDPEQTELVEFVTSGLSAEDEARIGRRPHGRGVLGLLITDPRPIRLRDLTEHPESYGFPPDHPPMRSFLGVPVRSRGEVYGDLYLTEKNGWSEFTKDDEVLIEALALIAGMAIERARLQDQVKWSALSEDRDRIAHDLHDSVIQRLFSAGLALQAVLSGATDHWVTDHVRSALRQLDETIDEIRSSVFQLVPMEHPGEPPVSVRLLESVREIEATSGLKVAMTIDGPIDTAVPPEVVAYLVTSLRDLLIDAGAPATDSHVALDLVTDGRTLQMTLRGMALSLAERSPTFGLLERRAGQFGGHLAVDPSEDAEVALLWDVPLTA